jgi:peptidoglycan/xylan/chitin deacetylase (PgdA/CDA1 family)
MSLPTNVQTGDPDHAGLHNEERAAINAAVQSSEDVGLLSGSVVFTFDDGTSDHYTTAWPVFQSRGKKATWFVPTGKVGTAGYITTAQAQEMVADGQELGGHTHSEVTLSDNTSEADIRAQLSQNRDGLLALGSDARTMAYVGGFHGFRVRQLVGEYFDVARTVNAYPLVDSVHFPAAVAQTASGDSESEADIKAKMDAALANRTDCIITTHVVDAAKATLVGNLLDYAGTIGLPVRTFAQAYDARVSARFASHGLTFGRDGGIGASKVTALGGFFSTLTAAERFAVQRKVGTRMADALTIRDGDHVELQTHARRLLINPAGNEVRFGSRIEAADAGVAFVGFVNSGMFRPSGVDGVGLRAAGDEQLRAAGSATDGDVGVLVRVNRGGTYSLDRVTIGDADSGGSGFRVLRVPN